VLAPKPHQFPPSRRAQPSLPSGGNKIAPSSKTARWGSRPNLFLFFPVSSRKVIGRVSRAAGLTRRAHIPFDASSVPFVALMRGASLGFFSPCRHEVGTKITNARRERKYPSSTFGARGPRPWNDWSWWAKQRDPPLQLYAFYRTQDTLTALASYQISKSILCCWLRAPYPGLVRSLQSPFPVHPPLVSHKGARRGPECSHAPNRRGQYGVAQRPSFRPPEDKHPRRYSPNQRGSALGAPSGRFFIACGPRYNAGGRPPSSKVSPRHSVPAV